MLPCRQRHKGPSIFFYFMDNMYLECLASIDLSSLMPPTLEVMSSVTNFSSTPHFAMKLQRSVHKSQYASRSTSFSPQRQADKRWTRSIGWPSGLNFSPLCSITPNLVLVRKHILYSKPTTRGRIGKMQPLSIFAVFYEMREQPVLSVRRENDSDKKKWANAFIEEKLYKK